MMKRASTGTRDESYEHVLMCLICRSLFDDYDHQPKFLPCHHTFCKDCLREYCRQIGDEIECPSCRKIANIPAAGVAALQTNFYIKYIQSLVSGGTGQSCHALECSKHADEKLQFYCTDCQQSLCKECCKEDGMPCSSHNKVPITKITEESHQKLDSSFSLANATIEGKKVKLEKALKALAEEKDSALLRIDSTFEQHAHTLTRRATLLKNKVIDIYNENVETLENDLMEISTALTCIVSLKDYHEDKIAHGDYKEFSKGIDEMEEVDKNITERIHPAETHIIFEGSHGSEKYRACAKDLGRVKFNRRVTMPRTEPEGNDSADGLAQASGSVPPSPTESPKHDSSSPMTPSSPNLVSDFCQGDDPQSPVRTPDSLGEPDKRCLPGSGFCDSTSSMPCFTEAAGSPLGGGSVAAGAIVMKTSMKSSMTRSSMTESQSNQLHQSKVCDVKPNKASPSNNSHYNSLSSEPSEKSKIMHASPPKSQLIAPKQNPVIHNKDSRKVNANKVTKSPPQLELSYKKEHPPPASQQQAMGVPASNTALSNVALVIPDGGRSRPRILLTTAHPPQNPATQGKCTVLPSNPPPKTQSAIKNNSPKSPKEPASSGTQKPVSKPSRLPGLSGMCRIPKPKGVTAKVQMQKGSGSQGFVRHSPTGQRVSPSSCGGNLRTNGNNPTASNPTMISARNANGNITMQSIPEGASIVNENDINKLKAEKEYYHLLDTSYDEEELLKELKSGKANLDDSDSWMTISSGDESNNTNSSSDEVLVEADQTTL